MAKLNQEFREFHDEIKIDTEAEALRTKRNMLEKDFEVYFPGECSRYSISVSASSLEFINQGSYKIGTTIKGSNVDLDLAVIFPLDIYQHNDPREPKKAARDALMIKNIRIPRIKEPCVTIAYHTTGAEYMHIDFPLYARSGGNLYLARGKEGNDINECKWEEADPKGLNDYFLAEFGYNEQIRRIVRFIKKWKQEKYEGSSNSHEIPPSVALTIWACQNFIPARESDKDNDLRSLFETMNGIKNRFIILEYKPDGNIGKVAVDCCLPVMPYSDVLCKMRDSDSHLVSLYERLSKAVDNLREAVELSSEHEAGLIMRRVLGDSFPVPEKIAEASAFVGPKEHNFGQ